MKKKMFDDNVVDMFDENGNLRTKEDILDSVSDVYDKLKAIKEKATSMMNPFEFDEMPIEELLDEFSFGERSIYILDEITPEYVHNFVLLIKYWNKMDEDDDVPVEEREPIKVYINTPGGELNTTFTIIDSIMMSKTPVYTISVGASYSGGFFIALAGDKRFGYPHSSYLLHEGAVNLESDAHKIFQQSDFYRLQLKRLKDFVLNRTKITREEYKEHQKDDWWFSAEQALKYGIIDEITKEII